MIKEQIRLLSSPIEPKKLDRPTTMDEEIRLLAASIELEESDRFNITGEEFGCLPAPSGSDRSNSKTINEEEMRVFPAPPSQEEKDRLNITDKEDGIPPAPLYWLRSNTINEEMPEKIPQQVIPDEFNTETKKDRSIAKSIYKIIKTIDDKINPFEIKLKQRPKEREVILVGVLVDDSISVEKSGNTRGVIESHNDIVESLIKSKEREKILFRTQYMNQEWPFNNWVPVDDAKLMTEEKYQPYGKRRLYDSSVKILGNAEAERERAMRADIKARFSVLIVSNGDDTASEEYTARDVKRTISDIFSRNDPKFSNRLTFMGMPNKQINYGEIAGSMGIDGKNVKKQRNSVMQILTPENNPASIRSAVEIFSKRSRSNK